MIISASRRSDIPAFYGPWLMNRVRVGYCKTVNPFNRAVSHVSLLPEDVDGFFFWTKNVGPFRKHLAELKKLGYSFIVHHTITGYPRQLEHSVVDADKAVEHLRRVAEDFGPGVCVWRYDPIINSSLTPHDFHAKTFSRLAKKLEGVTDEVMISFVDLYKKTLYNMKHASEEFGFDWSDPPDAWKKELAAELASIADAYRIRLTICCQPHLITSGCSEARCIDAARLAKVTGQPLKACVKGTRKECRCSESRDIGDYDTCPHGCIYCYAVRNQARAKLRYKKHDPMGETLFPLAAKAV